MGPVRPSVPLHQTPLVRPLLCLIVQPTPRSLARSLSGLCVYAHECLYLVSSQTGVRQLWRERAERKLVGGTVQGDRENHQLT